MQDNNRPNNDQGNGRPNQKLVKPDFLSYTTIGLKPVGVDFQMDINDLEKEIFNIVADVMPTVRSVTTQFDSRDPKKPLLHIIAWFNSNDRNFRKDIGDSMIGSHVSEISQEFKNFVTKYGYYPADDGMGTSRTVKVKEVLVSNSNREQNKLTGVRLSIQSILGIILDRDNKTFTSIYGVSAPQITLGYNYILTTDKRNKEHVTGIVGIRFYKKVKSPFDREKPYAKIGGRF